MKSIIASSILLFVGLIVGFSTASYLKKDNNRKLNEWFYIEKATSSFMSLYAKQNPEKFGNYHESDFLYALRTVEQLTDPEKKKEEIDWSRTFESIDEMGAKTLLKATDSEIENIDFSSHEVKTEIISLLKKIKSNQSSHTTPASAPR